LTATPTHLAGTKVGLSDIRSRRAAFAKTQFGQFGLVVLVICLLGNNLAGRNDILLPFDVSVVSLFMVFSPKMLLYSLQWAKDTSGIRWKLKLLCHRVQHLANWIEICSGSSAGLNLVAIFAMKTRHFSLRLILGIFFQFF